MKIDGVTGKMEHTQVRPRPGNDMDIRAEMDLLVALSACPDLAVGGKPVDVKIYEPSDGPVFDPPAQRRNKPFPRS